MSVKKTTETITPVSDTSAVVCVYIGPSKKSAIQTMSIYSGTKAEVLAQPVVKLATDKYPDVATLIVSADTLASARKEVKMKGTALYKAYNAVLKSE